MAEGHEPLPEEFFAECQEYLTSLRADLLALEGERPRSDLQEELRRLLHTLKGLFGMGAMPRAEELTHLMESVHRALGADKPSEDAVAALAAAVDELDRLLAGRRAGPEPAGPPSQTAARLARLAGGARPSDAQTGRQQDPVAEALRHGEKVLRFVFTPRPDLAARGVNVNEVRNRLSALGRILAARPLIGSAQAVSFEFLVATDAAAESHAAWAEDGIVVAALETEAAEPQAHATASLGTIRVRLDRLDELMRSIGELVVANSRAQDLARQLEQALPPGGFRELSASLEASARYGRRLRETATQMRLVPVGDAFVRMEFVVRELARAAGKRVRVSVVGRETQLDKLIVDRVVEPVLHLVRNAVAHGIEAPASRREAGKPEEGRLEIRVSAEAGRALIEVEDDGAGVDEHRVRARARELGAPQDGELLDILASPGFSTTREADKTSGRGVGMGAARKAIEELGGRLALRTRRGEGTVFSIELPASLLIAEALLVQEDGQMFAMPASYVDEVIEHEDGAAAEAGGALWLTHREHALTVSRLAALLGRRPTPARFLIVLRNVGASKGLLVERVVGQREIVVSGLTDPLVRVPGVNGAARLGDGSIALILDPPTLTKREKERLS